jgi:hypothetical protein
MMRIMVDRQIFTQQIGSDPGTRNLLGSETHRVRIE